MGRVDQDTTARKLLGAYEAAVSRLATSAEELRARFMKRTGAFGPEDAWFEARSRAFWDDALTGEGASSLVPDELDEDGRRLARSFARAHRGLFTVEDRDDAGARLVDAWSGAELFVRSLDEGQAVVLDHAEGLMDARVVAASEDGLLFVLPGAFHHAPDATASALKVLAAARERGMGTGDALDALLRMELVFRSSSRVKADFAYRVTSLGVARAAKQE